MCGLKLQGCTIQHGTGVTPCVGVWIETLKIKERYFLVLSHPAWVCGLKRDLVKRNNLPEGHTLRGCVD